MNDPILPPEPPADSPPLLEGPKPSAPPERPPHALTPRGALPVFTAIGFLCMFGALFFFWQRIQDLQARDSADPVRVAALEDRVRTLQQQRPAPPPPAPDLRPLEARLAALEQRPAPEAAPAPAPAVDLAPLEARLAAVEKIARVQAASLALDAGLPLGLLPGAPPALARFATTAPPTLAGLRARFPDAARAARAASQPAEAPSDWLGRLRDGLAGMLTLRRGDTVLIGAPAAASLAAAQARLDAGDLAAALAALAPLDPAAAAALAPWKADAQALLDARGALAALAHP